MQQHPPNTRRKGGGPKPAGPPRESKRSKALPYAARDDLLRTADFISALIDDAKRERRWTMEDIHQAALPYCGSMSVKVPSRYASRTYMATTSGIDVPMRNALLYALGSSPIALEEYLAGVQALTEEEREMLALMRAMSPEDVQRQLAVARLDAQFATQRAQLEGRPPSISLPRPPSREEEIAELDEHHRFPFRTRKDS